MSGKWNPLNLLKKAVNKGRVSKSASASKVRLSLDSLESRLVPTTIVRTSAPVFYNDLTPPAHATALTSNYVSYQITNNDGVDYGDVWVSVGDFKAASGAVAVKAGTNAPTQIDLGSLAKGQTKTAFFYLSSTDDDITATQTHTVSVFSGTPASGSKIANQNFSFAQTANGNGTDDAVQNTIQANANKVNSISLSNPSVTVGSTFTVTVKGETGTIGAGKVLAFTPASYSNWRADLYQLTNTSIVFSGGNTGTFNNVLSIPSASLSSTANTSYTATYTFKAMGATSGVTFSPIAYISSGQNVKHTKLGSEKTAPAVKDVPVFVSAAKTTFTYGSQGTYQVQIATSSLPVTYTISTGKLPAGVTLNPSTGLLSGTPAAGTLGTWNFQILASNSSGSATQNFSLTVVKANLVITASDQSKVYGANFTFAGTEFTTTGLAAGDTIKSVSISSSGSRTVSPVGSYGINISTAVVSHLDHYNITYVKGSMVVTKSNLTITANNVSKVYGSSVTLASNGYTAVGLINGDKINSLKLANNGTAKTANVGDYPVVASSAQGSGLGNYNIIYVDGNLKVTPAALTITANSRVKTQGSEVVLLGTEFQASGLKNSDRVTSVNLKSDGAAEAAALGDYAIVPAAAIGTGLANYTVTYANGNLKVVAGDNSPKSGAFTTNGSGKIQIDFRYDGGGYVGQMGVYNTAGMSAYTPGTDAYIKEVARRVLSSSGEGYLVINDFTDAAKNSQKLSFDGAFNSGTYRGIQDFQMDKKSEFAFVLIPNGTFSEVYANPALGGAKRALFSYTPANPAANVQFSDITGNGTVFGFEDQRLDGPIEGTPLSDRDYNDIVFKLIGANGFATSFDSVVNPGRNMKNDPAYPQVIN